MIRRTAASVLAAVTLGSILAPPTQGEPRLHDVLSSVTLSFGNDGGRDRAILVQNEDVGADLYIFRSLREPEAGKPAEKPAFFKKSAAYAGTSWGQAPSLSVNQKGSLVITSTNEGIGRNRFNQELTVVLRGGAFIVAGVKYASRDTLDLDAGGTCDINFLTGKGKRNDKLVAEKFSPIKLADWSDEKLPKPCRF